MKVSRPDISSTELQEFPVAERFLKLPLERFLEKMGIEPVPPQIAFLNAIQNPKYKYIVGVLARRTGKTLAAAIVAALKTFEPGETVLVIAPNYQLAEICFSEVLAIYDKFGIETPRRNMKDRVCELENGSFIRIASGNQIDSAVGRSYSLVLYDESALTESMAQGFNIALMPTLDKVNSKAIFISSPRGYNDFYDFYMKGFSEESSNWASVHSTAYDNPRLPPVVIADARKNMSTGEFSQEFLAEFVSFEGQVFDNLNDGNLDDLSWVVSEQYKTGRFDVIAGLDVGYRDATAMVVFYVDIEEGTWYLVDGWSANEKTTAQYAAKAAETCAKHDIDYIFIDSAAQQMKADFMTDYDLPCVNAIKDVNPGLGYVSSQIEQDKFVLDKGLDDIYVALVNYQWKSMDIEKLAKPKHTNDSHYCDAIRYAMYSYKNNVSLYE